MIIQHNIMALNSHRQLGINNNNLSANLEKLSSGYRINRAADDAAGLAISEKMRAQITGLNRAILNAKDGSSLIQTAEGAMSEIHSMLNRMVELATQSANGTIQYTDRQKIEAETQALLKEIDRISEATNFNGIKLLDGSLSASAARDVEVQGVKVTEQAAAEGLYTMDPVAALSGLQAGDVLEYTVTNDKGDSYTAKFTVSSDASALIADDAFGTKYALDTTDPTDVKLAADDLASALEDQFKNTKLSNDFIITATGDAISMQNRMAGTDQPKLGSDMTYYKNSVMDSKVAVNQEEPPEDEVRSIQSGSFIPYVVTNKIDNEDFATFKVNGQNFVLLNKTSADYAANVAYLDNRDVNIITISGAAPTANDLKTISAEINQKTGLAFKASDDGKSVIIAAPKIGNGLTMQVGDTADDFQKITVSVDDMSSMGLGIANISVTTQESAARSLTRIKAAIEKVNTNRGNLGALQNRLTYTINNLGVTTENMTAAESRVRDVDMASEMMQFTKNNVLSQAAQAMLAQANQQPQNVLQLLR